ncbi:MAG: cupin domain-containing protein [Gaiellaceae bacterium]
MHTVGSLASVAPDLGVYARRAESLTRRLLVGRDVGSVHQEVVHAELSANGRIDRHLHAFEEALYVLTGSVSIELAGERETLVADDFVWIDVGVAHAVATDGPEPATWLEVSAPIPGAQLEDTVFSETAGATPEVPYRRGRFDVAELPEPSSTLGLAGAGSANVGGAAVRLLVDAAFGASQLVLMSLRYVGGGAIKEHDHAFEEAFFFLEGEIEAVLDGEIYVLGAGDFCWSGVGSMHALANRSDKPVRWLETQAPQPPSRHQFRYRGDWERLAGLD